MYTSRLIVYDPCCGYERFYDTIYDDATPNDEGRDIDTIYGKLARSYEASIAFCTGYKLYRIMLLFGLVV